jgi:hypothetical protein
MPHATKTALLMIDIQQAMFGPDEICHEPERMLAKASDSAGARQGGGDAGLFRAALRERGRVRAQERRLADPSQGRAARRRAGHREMGRELVLQDRP